MKLQEIAEGWANYILGRAEEVSKLRMIICNKCEYISTKHETIRLDVHCVKCKCPLATKTRSLESECPIGKWKKIINEHTQKNNITENTIT